MIEEFATYLRAVRGFSENTIRAYSNDLATFAKWAKEHSNITKWRDIERDDIDMFLQYQQEHGYKPATTNRQLSAIASLFRYFKRQGYDVKNPCQYESRRKQGKTIPSTISPVQLANAYRHAVGVRKTMLGIFATTGIRIQELLDMKWEDIDFDANTILINGKGNKQRLVSTEPFVLADLKNTHETWKAQGKMFYLSQRKVRYMIYETLQPYCHARQLSPHAIRHTFATELAKHGENAMTIAKILGHSKIETSQKYVDMTQLSTPRKGICLT